MVRICSIFLFALVVNTDLNAQNTSDEYRMSVGSFGIQFGAQKNLSTRGGLQASISYFRLNKPFDYKLGPKYITLWPNGEFLQAGLYGNFYPFAVKTDSKGKMKRNWKLVYGVSTRFSVRYEAKATIKEKFIWGGSPVPQEYVGYVKVNLSTLRLQPYIGVGWETWFLKSRIGLFCDIGTNYQGKPYVELEATGILSNNLSNRDQLEKNLNEYRWYPGIMAGIRVKTK